MEVPLTESVAARRVVFFPVVVIVLFTLYIFTLAPGISWANYGVDSGDFAAAAVVLGIPHPPGYPTYTLLAHLFQRLPFSDPALAMNVLSALCTALAGGLFAHLVAGTVDRSERMRQLLGIISGLALGTAPLIWSQAVITEVHGLNLLFVVLGFYLARSLADDQRVLDFKVYAVALGLGLALGNHVTIVLVLTAVAVLWLRRWRSRLLDRPGLFRIALAVMLGALVYLYLPLRAITNPVINWGDPQTWGRFFWTISADPYQGFAFSLPTDQLPRRIAAWATLLRQAFGYPGLALGVLGLMYGRSRIRALDWVAVWTTMVYSVFSIGYSTADSTAYLIPAQLGFLWMIGLGLAYACSWIVQRMPDHAARVQYGLPALFLVSILAGAWAHYDSVDASHDLRAIDYARNSMQQAPDRAVILTWQAFDAFPLWYVHLALEQRPDLAVIVVPLLQYDWYQEQIAVLYPELEMPGMSILRMDDPSAPTPPEFWGRPVCFPQIQAGEQADLELVCEEG